MFPCSKGHSVKAYLDTIKMTLAGLCLVVLGFLRTKKDSHGKATNTEEQKEKKRKKEQKAVTVTKGIRETKKKKYYSSLSFTWYFCFIVKVKRQLFSEDIMVLVIASNFVAESLPTNFCLFIKKFCGQWSGTKVRGCDEYHNKYTKNPPFHICEMLFARSLIDSILTKCLIILNSFLIKFFFSYRVIQPGCYF